MTGPIIETTEVNRIWAESLRAIRHTQVNDLQLIRSYLKLQNRERLERCVAFALERLEQERILQTYGNPLWQARLLPFIYDPFPIRFQFEAMQGERDGIRAETPAAFEVVWIVTERIEAVLRAVAEADWQIANDHVPVGEKPVIHVRIKQMGRTVQLRLTSLHMIEQYTSHTDAAPLAGGIRRVNEDELVWVWQLEEERNVR